MPTAPSHPQLETWLTANAHKHVYWTTMTSVQNIEAVTTAMSDLHRMVVQDRDEDIVAFFSAVRKKLSEHAAPPTGNDEQCSHCWPPETD